MHDDEFRYLEQKHYFCNIGNADWDELESSYGIRKDYIMGNEQIARQLASGQVTDYVKCYAKVGNLTVIGPMALQANFRNDRVEVKHFTVNPNPDLSVYGDALRSDKVAESNKRSLHCDIGTVTLKFTIASLGATAGRTSVQILPSYSGAFPIRYLYKSATWSHSSNQTQTILPTYTVNGKSPSLIHTL